MARLTHTDRLFAPREAQRLAAEMQADDDEWTYTVIDDPKGTGYSRICITDDEGIVIGYV